MFDAPNITWTKDTPSTSGGAAARAGSCPRRQLAAGVVCCDFCEVSFHGGFCDGVCGWPFAMLQTKMYLRILLGKLLALGDPGLVFPFWAHRCFEVSAVIKLVLLLLTFGM